MIRNLFKRIAEFITGSSSDDESSAIPFAEVSRKKVEEQVKKERAERRRRSRDNKDIDTKTGEDKPQRGEEKRRGQEKTAKRTVGEQKPRREKTPSRNGRPEEAQRPAQEAAPKKESPRQPRKPAWSLEEFQVPEKEGEVRFHDLDLPVKLMHGIADLGFQYATPIQAGCLPETLKGKDAIGKAQTGTGKSAAFLITIINHLGKNPMRGGPEKGFPRALILAPTRELALQIEKDARELCKYTPYKILSLFGGTGYDKQKKGIAGSVDIIVATPGRLIDFKNQKLVDLSRVEILVIDEADRMLDMGFIPDIRKIVYATPHKDQRQTLFFSATYSSDVMRLAEQWTRDAHSVEIEPDKVESESIDQKVFLVTTDEKFPLLYNLIIGKELTKVLVFTNRRDQARRLSEKLNRYQIKADLLSGEVAQNKRIRALEDFRSGKVRVLVATDVAARGLHIDEISHVINYNLPQDPEHYVHRIGRTGRAGATGTSVSFACEDDSYYIPAIEELLGHKMICEYPEDELLEEVESPSRSRRQPRSQKPETQPSPWHEPLPSEEEEDELPLADIFPAEPIAAQDEPKEEEREEDAEAAPPRKRRSRGQRSGRSPRKAAPQKKQKESGNHEEPEASMNLPEVPLEKPAETGETAVGEAPLKAERHEPLAAPSPATGPRPQSQRVTRTPRKANAPKYRKRPVSRYGKSTRAEK